jgi:hypothetical protein
LTGILFSGDNIMQNAFNPLMNMYHVQLEASRRFADAIFSGTEKIDRVTIGATHRVFNEQITLAEAIVTVRDPRNIGAAFQSGWLSRKPEETVNYQQEILRIYAEMQNDIGKSLQEYIEQLGVQASGSARQSSETSRARTNDAVLNPMTNMFSLWESAFTEVASLAKKNMTTARSAVEDASGTMERAGNYATAVSDIAAEAQGDAEKQSIIVSSDTSGDKRGSGKRKS